MRPGDFNKEEYLEELYYLGGWLRGAADAVGCNHRTVMWHRNHDLMFDALVMDAIDRGQQDHPHWKSHNSRLTANNKRRSPKRTLESRPRPVPGSWKKKFLKAYAECGVISTAAKAACVSRATVDRTRQSDELFAVQMADCREEAYGRVIDAIFVNAVEKLNVVAQIFLAKSMHPELHAFETWKVRSSVELDEVQFHQITNAIERAKTEAGMSEEQQALFGAALRDNLKILEEQPV